MPSEEGAAGHGGDEAPPRWYAMLIPAEPLPDDYRRVGGAMATTTGGRLFDSPHVTVAYLRGQADPLAVAERLRYPSGPPVAVHAEGPFSFWEASHPIFGYTLALHVVKTAGFAFWHAAVVDALRPLGLVSLVPYQEMQLHARVVWHMAVPAAEAVVRLGPRPPALRFVATQLWVTMLSSGEFHECLRRPLTLEGKPPVAHTK